MNIKEFIKLIETVGFEQDSNERFVYKKFVIYLYLEGYNLFTNGSFKDYEYSNLEPIYNNFKNELRSIKLKKLLGEQKLIS